MRDIVPRKTTDGKIRCRVQWCGKSFSNRKSELRHQVVNHFGVYKVPQNAYFKIPGSRVNTRNVYFFVDWVERERIVFEQGERVVVQEETQDPIEEVELIYAKECNAKRLELVDEIECHTWTEQKVSIVPDVDQLQRMMD